MSDSDSDFEGATEYTGLMDDHVSNEARLDPASERAGRKRTHAAQRRDGYQSEVSYHTYNCPSRLDETKVDPNVL